MIASNQGGSKLKSSDRIGIARLAKVFSSGVLLLAIAAVPASSDEQGLNGLLEPPIVAKLMRDTLCTSSVRRGAPLSLLPESAFARTISDSIARQAPTYGIELLRIMRYPNSASRNHRTQYNALRSISTMEGITYYSASRNRQRVLFRRSFVVPSSESRQPVPDPLVTTIPVFDTIYMIQEDASFGTNTMQAQFRYSGDSILLTAENINTMWYLSLPFISAGAFQSHVLIIPLNEFILFYGVAGIRTVVLPGLRAQSEASLTNRLSALELWFQTTLADDMNVPNL